MVSVVNKKEGSMSELPFDENNENRTTIPPLHPARDAAEPSVVHSSADRDSAEQASAEQASIKQAPVKQTQPARLGEIALPNPEFEAPEMPQPKHLEDAVPSSLPDLPPAPTSAPDSLPDLPATPHTSADATAAPWPAPVPENRWTDASAPTPPSMSAPACAPASPTVSPDRTAPQRPLPPAFPTASPSTSPATPTQMPGSAQALTASVQATGNPFNASSMPTPSRDGATPTQVVMAAHGPTMPNTPASTNAPTTAQAAASTHSPTPAPPAPPVTRAPKRSGVSLGTLAMAMLLTAALSMGGMYALNSYLGGQTKGAAPTSSNTAAPTPASAAPEGTSMDWQAIAASVSPTVVTINVTAPTESGVGSGVIYADDGTIVTNHHVIMPAVNNQGRIQVTLKDGRLYEATIVGTDPSTDLAVIRLTNPPSDLTVATFGSSANLTVGAHVMAIGSPLGLSNTVTTGIISALDRPVAVQAKPQRQFDPNDPFGQLDPNANATESVVTNAIQVDASINPGNSGGPLFDASGTVIGINSSIASLAQSSSDTAGSIGLGFAIPVDLVRSVADQLIQTGTVAHAILGVNISTAAVEAAGTTYVSARIEELVPGGAAEKAGLRVGDAITHVDGSMVTSAKSLSGFIRRYTAGDTVTIAYIRDGKSTEVEVTLQAK